jgi:hypothetical protein
MATVELKENEDKDDLELWVESKFIVSFSLKEFKSQQASKETYMLRNILSYAVEAGKELRSKEIRKLIGE